MSTESLQLRGDKESMQLHGGKWQGCLITDLDSEELAVVAREFKSAGNPFLANAMRREIASRHRQEVHPHLYKGRLGKRKRLAGTFNLNPG